MLEVLINDNGNDWVEIFRVDSSENHLETIYEGHSYPRGEVFASMLRLLGIKVQLDWVD